MGKQPRKDAFEEFFPLCADDKCLIGGRNNIRIYNFSKKIAFRLVTVTKAEELEGLPYGNLAFHGAQFDNHWHTVINFKTLNVASS